MNERKNQERLLRELENSRNIMHDCNHVFNKPIYDSETIQEGYGSVQDGAGSDPHWSYAGYKDVEKDRWSRECKLCGFKEYTYKREPVIKSYEPKF